MISSRYPIKYIEEMKQTIQMQNFEAQPLAPSVLRASHKLMVEYNKICHQFRLLRLKSFKSYLELEIVS